MAKEKVYAGNNKVFTGFKYNSGTGRLSLTRKKKGKNGFISKLVSPKILKFPMGTQVESQGGGIDSKGDFITLDIKKPKK